MKIQESQTLVELLPLPVTMLSELQKESKEKTVVLSTRIEGNTLSEAQAKDEMYVHHDNVEEQEVFNLAKALLTLDEWEARELPITEERVKELHAIIQVTHGGGRRPQRSEYRTGQNRVGSRNASHFYLPPEASDVPSLMEDLIAWVNSPNQISLVPPIKAGIFMYQFLTIHPYYDGNGRTARMFATYILRRGGLGLKKLFVLESHYDRNLQAYYANLQLGLSLNYYFGRNDADISKWLEFFIGGMAEVLQDASCIVKRKSEEYTSIEPALLRGLDAEQRAVFGMLTFKTGCQQLILPEY